MIQKFKRLNSSSTPVQVVIELKSIHFNRKKAVSIGAELCIAHEKKDKIKFSSFQSVKQQTVNSAVVVFNEYFCFNATVYRESNGKFMRKKCELQILEKPATCIGKMSFFIHDLVEVGTTSFTLPIDKDGVSIYATLDISINVNISSEEIPDDVSGFSLDSPPVSPQITSWENVIPFNDIENTVSKPKYCDVVSPLLSIKSDNELDTNDNSDIISRTSSTTDDRYSKLKNLYNSLLASYNQLLNENKKLQNQTEGNLTHGATLEEKRAFRLSAKNLFKTALSSDFISLPKDYIDGRNDSRLSDNSEQVAENIINMFDAEREKNRVLKICLHRLSKKLTKKEKEMLYDAGIILY